MYAPELLRHIHFQYLLQNGADPRVFAEDGQTPEQVRWNSCANSKSSLLLHTA